MRMKYVAILVGILVLGLIVLGRVSNTAGRLAVVFVDRL